MFLRLNLMDNYTLLYKSYLEEFKKEFGEREFNSILNKIAKSEKVAKLINQSIDKNVALTHNEIVPCIMSMISFMFANKNKVALASVLVLQRWNYECNTYYQLKDDHELYKSLRDILKSCDEML